MSSENSQRQHAWLQLLFASVAVFFVQGCTAYGLYQNVLINSFFKDVETDSKIATVGAISIAFTNLVGIFVPTMVGKLARGNPLPVLAVGFCFVFAGYLGASFGTRLWHLVLCQGFLVGCGIPMVCGPLLVGIPLKFDEKERRLPTAILATIGGIGGLFMVPSTARVIVDRGLDWGYRTAGITCGLSTLLAIAIMFTLRTLQQRQLQQHHKLQQKEAIIQSDKDDDDDTTDTQLPVTTRSPSIESNTSSDEKQVARLPSSSPASAPTPAAAPSLSAQLAIGYGWLARSPLLSLPLSLSAFFAMGSFFLPLFFIPSETTRLGYHFPISPTLAGCFGGSTGLGRGIAVFFAAKYPHLIRRTHLAMKFTAAFFAYVLWVPRYDVPALYFVFIILYGLAAGLETGLQPLALNGIVRDAASENEKSNAPAVGGHVFRVLMLVHAFGAMLWIPIAGYLLDTLTDNPANSRPVSLLCAILWTASGISFALGMLSLRR
ncbi:MFS general substrate transporter [Ramicandelaber brevisporus]|nr:MFS general substrate transporter [Ramicandelaber brevisporus]